MYVLTYDLPRQNQHVCRAEICYGSHRESRSCDPSHTQMAVTLPEGVKPSDVKVTVYLLDDSGQPVEPSGEPRRLEFVSQEYVGVKPEKPAEPKPEPKPVPAPKVEPKPAEPKVESKPVPAPTK